MGSHQALKQPLHPSHYILGGLESKRKGDHNRKNKAEIRSYKTAYIMDEFLGFKVPLHVLNKHHLANVI
jgi:hypothetical protein